MLQMSRRVHTLACYIRGSTLYQPIHTGRLYVALFTSMSPEFATALGGIALIPQFFIWRCTWNPKDAKYEKHPIYHRTNPYPMDSADPANWMSFDAACEALNRYRLEEPSGVFALGWRMTQDCGYWFLDLDAVIEGGQWHPKALEWYGKLPGVFFEYSSSGNGAHFIGRGALPAHRKKCNKGTPINCELYTEARGICFGLTGAAWGSADHDGANAAILDILVEAFAPTAGADDGEAGRWDHGPRADWSGPTDDDELLTMAMRAKSVMGVLGHKATFAQLWSNAPELGKLYTGDSEKDGALAMHLAFWTGCDAVRIERLMRRSALVRPKWDEHRTYLKELTIETACDRQGNVYKAPVVRELYAPGAVTGAVEVISAAQVAGLDVALDLISSATSEVDVHNRVIPGIKALGLPPALLPRVIKGINKTLKFWGADLPTAQLRDLLRGGDSGAVRVAGQVGDLRPLWVEDYVYLTNSDKFLEKPSGQLLSGQALHRKMARQPSVPMTNAGTKMDVAKLLTEQWDVKTVHDCAYHANLPEQFEFEGAVWANLYNPFTRPLPAPGICAEAQGAIDLFVAHVRRICKGEHGAADVLLNWMAWQVQRTGQKLRWMPLIVGVEGSGKSLFARIMQTVLGTANVNSVGTSTICNSGGFTDWAEGRAVQFFEEIRIVGLQKYQVWDTVKPFVTNDTNDVNRKGRKGVNIQIGTNHFAFSNFDDALPLSDSDRRAFVIRTPFSNMQGLWMDAGVKNDDEYFGAMFDSLRMHPGAWVRWLLDRQIPNDFPVLRAPYTHAKARMAGAGREEIEDIARALIEEGAVGLGYAPWAFSTMHLCGALAMRGHKVVGPTVHFMFSRMGFQKIGKARSGNSYTSIYVKSEFVDSSPTEIYKRLMG